MTNKTPSEYYNLPVIGRIKCQLKGSLNGVPYESDVDEYDVIKVIDGDNNSKIYLCNVWNSPDKAQLVPDVCVISYEEK